MNILKDEGIQSIFGFCFFIITIPVILYEVLYNTNILDLSSNTKVYVMVILTAISVYIGLFKNLANAQDNGLND